MPGESWAFWFCPQFVNRTGMSGCCILVRLGERDLSYRGRRIGLPPQKLTAHSKGMSENGILAPESGQSPAGQPYPPRFFPPAAM
jgi:hypothetical protein